MSPKVWFITGCSSGLGFALARIALSQGQKVIASSRNPAKTPELVKEIKRKSGEWIALDVTATDVAEKIREAEKVFGDIDVLVNNAGYSLLGAMEDIDEASARAQMETNFYGPMKTMQAVLPKMRKRKSGTIVNISSIAGLTALPTCSLYASSKFALEALSESLAAEVSEFNIRILIVEPGGFRTNFLGSNAASFVPLNEDYKGTVTDKIMNHFGDADGKQIGDVEKGCQRMYEVVMGEGMAKGKKECLRLPLGEDCLKRAREKIDSLRETMDEMEGIAMSTAHVD